MMFVQWKIVGKERVRLLMLQCLVLTASVILVGRRYRLVLWPSPIVVFPTVSASLPVSLRACMYWLECEVLMIFFVSVLKLITIMSMPASRIYVFCTQQNRYIYIYIYIYISVPLDLFCLSLVLEVTYYHLTDEFSNALLFFYLVSYAWYFFFPLGCLLNFRQALKYSYNFYNTFLLCCDTDPISDVLICSEVR